ncbi:MAG: DNA repair protein RecO [Albidovulum sp.]
MDWRDEGALLAVRRHGETAAIIEVFTRAHGRHAGVVPGGSARRLAPFLQPGAQLDLAWRARLEDHIGTFTVEPVRARTGLLGDRHALAALNAVCALLHTALPEREPHAELYAATIGLLDRLGEDADWPLAYVRWELGFLEELGYGLDLSACAVTGARDDLAYVSPRTGRAVARGAAGDWADRLLPLPPCLLGQGAADATEIAAALRTTGHFLERRLFPDLGPRPLPEARRRFAEMFARHV